MGFSYLNTSGFKNGLQPLTLEWLDQWFPNFFERDPNLNLVNTSRPKPQRMKKIMIV